jgi:hypothetical protein
VHDGSFTEAPGSAHAGDRSGSWARESVPAAAPPGIADGSSRSTISWLIFLAMGVRRDSGTLGVLLTWGASSSQFLLAIALVWIAAHEGTPAGRLSRQIVRSVAAAAFLAVVSITLLTASLSPPGRPARISPWIAGFACGLGSTIAGGILILLFSLIYRKSIAARPTVAGALYGAAAGVAINADWRIVCPVSTLPHALGAHGTAIVATMLLGALLGRALGNRRLYKSNRRS